MGSAKVKICEFLEQLSGLSVISQRGLDFVIKTAEIYTFVAFMNSCDPFFICFIPENTFIF